MGAQRTAFVVALVAISGCGLVDAGDGAAPEEFCAEVLGRTPAYIETTQNEYDGVTTTSVKVYTEEGWRLRSLSDVQGPDQWGWEAVYVLDEQGRTTREDADFDVDGVPDRVIAYEYESDGGRLLSTTTEVDGVIVRAVTWDYSVDGRSILRMDEDGDGEIELAVSTFVGSTGETIRFEFDQSGDGTIEGSEAYSYDEAGLLVREARYDGDDGEPDSITTHAYEKSDDGRVLSATSESFYDDLAGNPTHSVTIERFTHDAEGRVVRREVDEDADGTVEATTELSYDAEGRLLREHYLDSFAYHLCEYEYEEGPDPVVTRCDEDLNDDWERITTRSRCPTQT